MLLFLTATLYLIGAGFLITRGVMWLNGVDTKSQWITFYDIIGIIGFGANAMASAVDPSTNNNYESFIYTCIGVFLIVRIACRMRARRLEQQKYLFPYDPMHVDKWS